MQILNLDIHKASNSFAAAAAAAVALFSIAAAKLLTFNDLNMFFQARQQQGCLTASREMPFLSAWQTNTLRGWQTWRCPLFRTHGRASEVGYKHLSRLPGLTERWAQTFIFLASRRRAAHILETV